MNKLHELEKYLQLPRITIPEVKIIGQKKSIVQFAKQIWGEGVAGMIAFEGLKEVELKFEERENILMMCNQKVFEGKDNQILEQLKGDYKNGLVALEWNRNSIESSLVVELGTMFRLFISVNWFESCNILKEQGSRDILSPVILIIDSDKDINIQGLNWRIHYLGIILAKNQGEQLKQAGLSYQRKYKQIKWTVIPTQNYQQLPQYLPSQGVKSGMKQFQKSLISILIKPIKRTLQHVKRQYSIKIIEYNNNILSLGQSIPQSQQKKLLMIWNLITNCTQRYCQQIKGRNNMEPGSTITTYSGGIVLKALFRDLYKQIDLSPVASFTNDTLQKMIKMYQNDSIPGFPSIQSFKYILTPHLYKLKQPSINLLNDVFNYLRVIYSKIFRESLKIYGDVLLQYVFTILDQYMQKLTKKTQTIILGNIQCQLEVIMSNDNQYNNKHSDLVPKQLNDNPNTRARTKSSVKDTQAQNRQTNVINSFRARVQDYYRLIIKILRDIIPKNIGYFLIMQSQQGMQIQIYRKLLQKKQLIDNIQQTQQTLIKRIELVQQVKKMREKINEISIYQSKIL